MHGGFHCTAGPSRAELKFNNIEEGNMLDRKFQRELLTKLAETYPLRFDHRDLCRSMDDDAQHKYAANLMYLEEHGLAESGVNVGLNGDYTLAQPKITAKGLDFLADDGGLSAILSVVTVRFEQEQLRSIIEAKISTSNLAPEEKGQLLTALRSLPAEATKHLTIKLLDQGLSLLPDVGHFILKLLST